jgi:predicted alpha-1,2-mannosidase
VTSLVGVRCRGPQLCMVADPCALVDPFVGTEAIDLLPPTGIAARWFYLKAQIGNTHPGACVPFSPMSVCPYSGAYPSGYGVYDINTHGTPGRIHERKVAYGVSHVHHSGTGYIDQFYNFFLTTPTGPGLGSSPVALPLDLTDARPFDLENETAVPGSYTAHLRTGAGGDAVVQFELTTTNRVAVHRYRGARAVTVDITHEGLIAERTHRRARRAAATVAEDGRLCSGSVVLHGVEWWFAALCCVGATAPQAVKPQLWHGGSRGAGRSDRGWLVAHASTQQSMKLGPGDAANARAGVLFHPEPGLVGEDGGPMVLYLALSLASVETAQAECLAAADAGFDRIRAQAWQRWEEHLGRVQVHGARGTPSDRSFYTALYHSFIKPVELGSPNHLWSGGPSLYADFATMWDQYKTQLPLMLTLFPEHLVPMVRSFVAVEGALGYLPPSLLVNDDPTRFFGQSRALCHVTLFDAFLHWRAARDAGAASTPGDEMTERVGGVKGAADTVDAVEEDVGLAENEPSRRIWDPVLEAMLRSLEREAAAIVPGEKQSWSQLLDIGIAAACTLRLATALQRRDLANRARRYAARWRDAFDPETGMMRQSDYYEAGPVNYSFRLMHDMRARVALCGSADAFIERLDRFFGIGAPPITQLADPPWEPARQRGLDLGRFDGTNNEVALEAPYAYHFVGRPDRTAQIVDAILRFHYRDSPGGLPGNDDSGALSSWYAWNSIGLFPVAGQGIMLVGTPQFDSTQLQVGGAQLTVTARRQSPQSIYPAAIQLRGVPLSRSFITYEELHRGGTLTVRLADHPGSFRPTELPPSLPLGA